MVAAAAIPKKSRQRFYCLSLFLALSYNLSNSLFEGWSIVSPHDSSVQVRRTFVIGVRQHRNHRNENLFNTKNRSPPFICTLLWVEFVLSGRMQDRNAHFSIGVYVRMPHFGCKCHGRGHVGKIRREDQSRFEEPPFEECPIRSHDQNFPFKQVAIVYEADWNKIDGVFGKICFGEDEAENMWQFGLADSRQSKVVLCATMGLENKRAVRNNCITASFPNHDESKLWSDTISACGVRPARVTTALQLRRQKWLPRKQRRWVNALS